MRTAINILVTLIALTTLGAILEILLYARFGKLGAVIGLAVLLGIIFFSMSYIMNANKVWYTAGAYLSILT